MTADQSPNKAGKAQVALTKTVRAVTKPGGKDVDWEKVRAVGAIIGAVTVLHGLKTRSWRYLHTAATALAIGAAAAARLKARYAGASQAPEADDPHLRSGDDPLSVRARPSSPNRGCDRNEHR
jgi:hypothetical protein